MPGLKVNDEWSYIKNWSFCLFDRLYTLCSTIICCTRNWISQWITGRPSTSSSLSGLSNIGSWWVGEAGHMLLGVLDINGALVSLTSLPSVWLRLQEQVPPRPVVPVSIHGEILSCPRFVCNLQLIYVNRHWYYEYFIRSYPSPPSRPL